MGDIDHGRADFLMQSCDLHAHLNPQFRVEIRQRFIEQKHLRPAHNGTADRYPLPLPTRESSWLSLEVIVKFQNPASFGDLLRNLMLWMAIHTQAKPHVFLHGHMRIERIGLEYHRHAAPRRVFPGDIACTNRNGAARGILKPSHHPQQGRFSTTRRADKDTKFAIFDLKINPMYDLDFAIFFGDIR